MILEVAGNLFTTLGFAETTLVLIAYEAGVSVVTLSKYFGDKNDIFRAVIQANARWAVPETATITLDDSLFLTLQRAARQATAATYRSDAMSLARLMIAESLRFPELMTSIFSSTFAAFLAGFERLFVALEAGRFIPPGDHARSALLFHDAVIGCRCVLAYMAAETLPPSDAEIDDRVAFFIQARFNISANSNMPIPNDIPKCNDFCDLGKVSVPVIFRGKAYQPRTPS